MRRYAPIALLALALLAGCGKKEESSSSSSGSGSGSTAASSKFGTPEDTAKTFFACCAAADWKGVGACCSKTEEEIAEIRDDKLSEHEKESFKKGLGAAKAGAVTKAPDGKSAEVKFSASLDGEAKDGVLKMALEGSDWKVTDIK